VTSSKFARILRPCVRAIFAIAFVGMTTVVVSSGAVFGSHASAAPLSEDLFKNYFILQPPRDQNLLGMTINGSDFNVRTYPSPLAVSTLIPSVSSAKIEDEVLTTSGVSAGLKGLLSASIRTQHQLITNIKLGEVELQDVSNDADIAYPNAAVVTSELIVKNVTADICSVDSRGQTIDVGSSSSGSSSSASPRPGTTKTKGATGGTISEALAAGESAAESALKRATPKPSTKASSSTPAPKKASVPMCTAQSASPAPASKGSGSSLLPLRWSAVLSSLFLNASLQSSSVDHATFSSNKPLVLAIKAVRFRQHKSSTAMTASTDPKHGNRLGTAQFYAGAIPAEYWLQVDRLVIAGRPPDDPRDMCITYRIYVPQQQGDPTYSNAYIMSIACPQDEAETVDANNSPVKLPDAVYELPGVSLRHPHSTMAYLSTSGTQWFTVAQTKADLTKIIYEPHKQGDKTLYNVIGAQITVGIEQTIYDLCYLRSQNSLDCG